MKIFGRYLSYRLRQSLLRTVIFAAIALIITQLIVKDQLEVKSQYFDTGVYLQSTFMGILATVIPILECAGLKQRRNLDTLYSFAINRKSMALAYYFSGLIQLLLVYTVSFWYHIILIADRIDMTYVPVFYFLSLLAGLFMYHIFMYLNQKANSLFDGIAFCIAGMFLLCLCVEAYNLIYESCYVAINNKFLVGQARYDMPDSSWGIVYAPINNMTVDFEKLINPNRRQYKEFTFDQFFRESAIYWLFWLLSGFACLWGYIHSFLHKGAQKVGDISDSFVGYKLFIPFYAYLGLFLLGDTDYWAVALCMAAFYIAYVIYRRSFKIRRSDLILLACGILPLLLRSGFDWIAHIS